MATMRRAITRSPQSIADWEWRYLFDEPETADDAFDRLLLEGSDRERELWTACRDQVLALWAQGRPGTRPLLWWAFDAPEPRRRLGGTGTPMFEVLGNAPRFDRGVPRDWLEQSTVDCYRNHLKPPIHIAELAYDPDDPPIYESEPAYLRRHNLLLPGELRRLKAADFEPVPVILDPLE
jgi:hypothetical protein